LTYLLKKIFSYGALVHTKILFFNSAMILDAEFGLQIQYKIT
jgi:hypothetical protein